MGTLAIVLVGKMGSGKTSVARYIAEHDAITKDLVWGDGPVRFEQVKTYTTRKRRKGEPKDAYNFVDEKTFSRMLDEGAFAEWYRSSSGTLYGSTAESLRVHFDEDDTQVMPVVVLTPSGADAVRSAFTFYLDVDEDTLRKRLAARGTESEKEIEKRLFAENFDFAQKRPIDEIAHHIDCDDLSVAEVAEKIIQKYQSMPEW